MTANETASLALIKGTPADLDRFISAEMKTICNTRGSFQAIYYLQSIISALVAEIPQERLKDMPAKLDIYRR